MPTESYFYLEIQLENFMMIFNRRVGPVITQMNNTQKMKNSEMITQNIPNLHVCHLEENESKMINRSESKLYVCSTENNKNKKGLLLIHVLQTRANKKRSYKYQYDQIKIF